MENKLIIRFEELSEILLAELNEDGFWTGKLSSSALSVSVAIAALHFHNAEENRVEILQGFDWLKNKINSDGSFGDTPESPGNISTSLLVYAVLNLYSSANGSLKKLQNKIIPYLQKNGIEINSDWVAAAILAHYKKDYTFSVPILTMCALCGIPGNDGFEKIPQLPFELALMPQKFYRLLNLSVVSYAIPALIAVGIVIFKKKNSGSIARWIRRGAEKKALKILQNSMPESGGFLEAIPLTAFVSISLLNSGYGEIEVVKKGIAFLKRTQREDGGWPIDVDLSTWVTTLSIKALRSKRKEVLTLAQQNKITDHLKSIQNKVVHPFNGTGPGAWGWTNFSGSVPDGDDTPGAILALLQLQGYQKVKNEVLAGTNWLLQLQNSDGGFPTFSKGWGKLPFDQSCADVTGHCILAIVTVFDKYNHEIPSLQAKKLKRSLIKAINYLQKHQLEDGSWLPLWFGNQHTSKQKNPVYGTARVLTYLKDSLEVFPLDFELRTQIERLIKLAVKFLVDAQNRDGSWGGDILVPGSIEETSLAISALTKTDHTESCRRGLHWLDKSYEKNGLKAAPIGLYFASLWYDEKLYPLAAYLEAIVRSLEA